MTPGSPIDEAKLLRAREVLREAAGWIAITDQDVKDLRIPVRAALDAMATIAAEATAIERERAAKHVRTLEAALRVSRHWVLSSVHAQAHRDLAAIDAALAIRNPSDGAGA